MDYYGVAYIVGGAGDGKTSLMLSLLLQIWRDDKTKSIFILNFDELKKDFKSVVLSEFEQNTIYVLVDDIFGKTNPLSPSEIENTDIFECLEVYIRRREIKLLMTMRNNIYKTLHRTLSHMSLFAENHCIDLTEGEFLISQKVRLDILTKYLTCCPFEIKMSKDMDFLHRGIEDENEAAHIAEYELQLIANGGSKEPHTYIEGFPFTCSMFIKTKENFAKGRKYFSQNARQIMMDDVEMTKRQDVKRYSVLVYTMLHDGYIDPYHIDDDTFKRVCISLEISEASFTMEEFQRQIHNEHYYLHPKQLSKNEGVGFVHETVFEATILSYGIKCTSEIISLCKSFRMIFELIRTKQVPEEIGLIVLPHLQELFAQRLMKEIKAGNGFIVGGHAAMDDEEFVKVFLAEVIRQGEEGVLHDVLIGAVVLGRTKLASILIDGPFLSHGIKAIALHVAAWYSSPLTYIILNNLKKMDEKEEMYRIVSNTMITLAEKGNLNAIEKILDIVPFEFFTKESKRFMKVFNTACYFGEVSVLGLLYERCQTNNSNVLNVEALGDGLCQASMTGKVSVFHWMKEKIRDISNEKILEAVQNACMFLHMKFATILVRSFEDRDDELKSNLRKCFHRCFKGKKLQKISAEHLCTIIYKR